MGMEIQVDSLEDMCALMCDNVIPKPKRKEWVFTFGVGQQYSGKFVKIKGTYDEARDEMCRRYGDKWAFQYSIDEWEELESDPNRYWPMETELK